MISEPASFLSKSDAEIVSSDVRDPSSGGVRLAAYNCGLEMIAALATLFSTGELLRGKIDAVYIDNSNSMGALVAGSS